MKNKPLINAHQTLMLLKDLNFHEINNKNKIALISNFFNSMLWVLCGYQKEDFQNVLSA